MSFKNTKEDMLALVKELEQQGNSIVIFGGWTAELLGIKEPWAHKDIDLLLLAKDFRNLVSFVQSKQWEICKSYAHKKAFLINGVMIEVFLVSGTTGANVTQFIGNKGSYSFEWGDGLFVEKVVNNYSYKLASKIAISKYDKEHDMIFSNGPWK